MKIYLRSQLNGAGWVEVTQGEQTLLPPQGGVIRICLEEEERIKNLSLGGTTIEWPYGQMEVELPCHPDEEGSTALWVTFDDGTRVRHDFIQPPKSKPNTRFLEVIADFRNQLSGLLVGGRVPISRIYEAVDSGSLILLARRDPVTGVGTGWLLDSIEKALPFLLNVCDRPRLHLRKEEAVRPVDVVRRVGPAALRHLASHSEHWETRTVDGIRPARLYAEVIEDDLELYENRFVKSLIDRLIRHVSDKRLEVEQIRDQLENAIEWDEYAEEFRDYRRQLMLLALLPNMDIEKIKKEQYVLERLLKRLTSIQHILAQCIGSHFYQALQNCEPVSSPIRATNILTMDPDYRPLFELWLEMDLQNEKQQDAIRGSLPHDLEEAYCAYCQVMLLVALRLADFTLTGDSEQNMGSIDADGHFRFRGTFSRGAWTVMVSVEADGIPRRIVLAFKRRLEKRFPIDDGVPIPESIPGELGNLLSIDGASITFHERPTDEEFDLLSRLLHVERCQLKGMKESERQHLIRRDQKWAGFIGKIRNKIPRAEEFKIQLIPLLIDLGEDPNHVARISEFLLDDALFNTTKYGVVSSLMLLPSSVRTIAESTSASVIRRIINYGDTFVESDMKKWGDRKTGILPISPWQTNSLQRFIRLLNIWTLGRDIYLGNELSQCPICDGTSIIASGDKTFKCWDCGAEWGLTLCANPDCRHEFGWLRPGVKSARQARDGVTMAYGAWIERLENIAGGTAIVGFCEAPDEKPIAVPICPRCGKCSRHKRHSERCPRCKGDSGDI